MRLVGRAILEAPANERRDTFVDRGQLRQLAEPTRLANGKRIPGLKLDHPRPLALMHALVRFAHIAAGDTFTTRDLHAPTAAALDTTTDPYRLAAVRSDLSKLRAKGRVERVPHSRRYRLRPHGYAIGLLFLKLFERVSAPLTAGLLRPVTADARLAGEKRHRLDRLYQHVTVPLDVEPAMALQSSHTGTLRREPEPQRRSPQFREVAPLRFSQPSFDPERTFATGIHIVV
jgi:hypothetical protein